MDGKRKTSTSKKRFSLIPEEKFLALYAAMLRCRALDERLCKLAASDYESGAGFEAVIAGAAIDLRPEDTVSASPRGLLASFVKGEPLKLLLQRALLNNRNGLQARDRKPLTAADKAHHSLLVTLDFRTGSPAPPLRSLRAARDGRRPILFFSDGSPRARKTSKAAIPTIPVDRGDVIAVYRVASECVTHARKSHGPSLIECVPFQISGAGGRREESDPIRRMEAYLKAKGLLQPGMKRKVLAAFAREFKVALAAASLPEA